MVLAFFVGVLAGAVITFILTTAPEGPEDFELPEWIRRGKQ